MSWRQGTFSGGGGICVSFSFIFQSLGSSLCQRTRTYCNFSKLFAQNIATFYFYKTGLQKSNRKVYTLYKLCHHYSLIDSFERERASRGSLQEKKLHVSVLHHSCTEAGYCFFNRSLLIYLKMIYGMETYLWYMFLLDTLWMEMDIHHLTLVQSSNVFVTGAFKFV